MVGRGRKREGVGGSVEIKGKRLPIILAVMGVAKERMVGQVGGGKGNSLGGKEWFIDDIWRDE